MKRMALPYIPDEIVLKNILPRLPSKSLLRFKCVSKRWHSTISHPRFTNADSIFAMIFDGGNTRFYTLDDEASFEAVPTPWKDNIAPDCLSNSCNGLVLIRQDGSLFLCNPSTRYITKVLTLDRLLDEGYTVTLGLCHDRSIDDYKALVWLYHQTPDYGGEFVVAASLKRKRWTGVYFPFDSVHVGPVVNERLHLAVSKEGTDRFSTDRIMVSFDSVNNKFEEFPTPKPKYREDNAIVGLGVLDGCLCISRWDNACDFEGNVEVLSMKIYGVVESWTTMFVLSNLIIRPHYGLLTPLIVTRNGEILFSINDKKILAYDPAKNLGRNVRIPVRNFSYLFAAALVQNLVSPVGYYWDRKRHQRRGKQITWDEARD